MKFLITKTEDHIFHIILNRGKSNAIDLEMVNELIQVVDEAKEDPAIEGLIISGKEGFFSSGLDLITLYQYDENQMHVFWDRFMVLVQKLISFPKPMVSAVTGHSPAGGCVLAICCDYRVMVEGDYILGLNEVPVGIVVPESIFQLYSFWLGKGPAYRSLITGKLFNPTEAYEVGLIDEVVPFNRIQNAAVRRVKSLTQFEQKAWQLTKLNLRAELIRLFDQNQEETIGQILKQWWQPSTRAVLKTIIDNLTQKKG